MDRRYYSKRHFDRLSNGGPDTPEQVAERLAHRKALEQAYQESLVKFLGVSAPDPHVVLAWMNSRIEELKAEFLKT